MGGMALSYFGGVVEMWGQLRLMNARHGNSVDVTLVIEQDRRSEIRSAVWEMPDHSEASVALGSKIDHGCDLALTLPCLGFG